MTQNEEQHKLFMPGCTAMETYFKQVLQTPEIYDGKKVKKMVETFGPVFTAHLTQEIDTLTPQNLATIFPEEKDLEKNFKEMLDWIVSTSSKTTTMPWVCLTTSSLTLIRF